MVSQIPFSMPDDWDVFEVLRQAEQLGPVFERQFPRPWAEKYLRIDGGDRLRFDDRPWLKPIYDDRHPQIVVQKAAQTGLTTCALVWALHLAAIQKKTVIYTLPNEGDIEDFVAARVDPMIDNSPCLRKLSGREAGQKAGSKRAADNRGLKRLGDGTIYFRGTQTSQGAISIPAHALIHDELDHSQPRILDLFNSRLSALPPAERKILAFSTPTVSGYGINLRYENSDGRQWLVRCAHCNWQGPLDYFEHTHGELAYLRCTRCGGKLDPRDGSWVPAHPGRDVHGYMVSRLMLAAPERGDLLEALHKRRAEALYPYTFYNMELGLPSEEGADRITLEEILKSCFVESYTMSIAAQWGTGPYFMGVDQGDTLTVAIGRMDPRLDSGHLRVVYLGRLSDPSRGLGAWEQVAKLMVAFNISLAVVDAQPNSAPAHDLASKFPGRVLLAYYTESQRTEVSESAAVRQRAQEDSKWPATTISATDRVDVTINRGQSLDQTAESLRSGVFLLPGPPSHPDVQELIQHCLHNVRRQEEAADGTPVHRWKGTGPNDYFHSLNYLRIAAEESAHLAQLKPVFPVPPILYAFTPKPAPPSPYSPLGILQKYGKWRL